MSRRGGGFSRGDVSRGRGAGRTGDLSRGSGGRTGDLSRGSGGYWFRTAASSKNAASRERPAAAAQMSSFLGALTELPGETMVHALCFLDVRSLAMVVRAARATSVGNKSMISTVVRKLLELKFRCPDISPTGNQSWTTALYLVQAATTMFGSPETVAFMHRSRISTVGYLVANWDPNVGSSENVVSDRGRVIAKHGVNAKYPWHAAFLKLNTQLHASCLYARFDFLVETTGGGILEIGVATHSTTAKFAALHWPGLRDTQAFTFANTGQRFLNIPGIDQENWCQTFGEQYNSGDMVSLEFIGGALHFLVNNRPQGSIIQKLPSGPLHVGATLTDDMQLRLLTGTVPFLLEV